MDEPDTQRRDVIAGRGSTTTAAAKRRQSRRDIAAIFFFAVVGLIIIGFRLAGFALFGIPSRSMSPTLLVGDYLIVSEYRPGYSRHSLLSEIVQFEGRIWENYPERGDVAVYRNPRDLSEHYIMRIVGLPGDRIQVKKGVLHIDDKSVALRRMADFELTQGRAVPQFTETLPNGRVHPIIEEAGENGYNDNTREFIVPEGHYFTLGDNRDNAADSRVIGPIPAGNLVGRAEVVVFSSNGFRIRFDRIFHGIE